LTALERVRAGVVSGSALLLPIFALLEINYPNLRPQSQLAIFATLGLVLCFLRRRPEGARAFAAAADLALALVTLGVGVFVVLQTEPVFSHLWLDGVALGDRAGAETIWDLMVGFIGLVLILEATRRTIGWALPMLALAFLLYGRFGAVLPDWLLPHRGYNIDRLVGQAFLHSQGVFGIALRVMFTYVFLFVIFGAALEATGATGFIVAAARRLFARSTGGAAKVSVLSSGLMGSLSGSAVANTATTGTFTIPMMRSAGFSPRLAAGVEAAASTGGALVPPVMGAGAYMMLEIISPPVTYVEIIRAALIPACLYYLSLFFIVHFSARLHQSGKVGRIGADEELRFEWLRWEGAIFLGGLVALVVFLLLRFSVFRAVTLALALVLILSAVNPRTRLNAARLKRALIASSAGAVPLVAAAASVGIIVGIVTLTGIGTRLPSLILPLAEQNLLAALVVIMLSSIVLGMGLPSAVCYLLMATLIGPVLGKLGVVPLAAHLFIFYFGMMSMVTPPVALAAYAASSIAGARFLETSYSAFRIALVGFMLPFLFVFRPELLMLDAAGDTAPMGRILVTILIAVLGIVPLAAAIAGYLGRPLGPVPRTILLFSAALSLFPGSAAAIGETGISWLNLLGVLLFATVWLASGKGDERSTGVTG